MIANEMVSILSFLSFESHFKEFIFLLRFVTVTRTYTTVSSEQFTTTEPPVLTITPTPASTSSTPFFQTETIPAPENILTSSYPEPSIGDIDHFGLAPSIETLPAVGKFLNQLVFTLPIIIRGILKEPQRAT